LKTFRIEIKTSMIVDAIDALAAVAAARYHFLQMCKRGEGAGTDFAREAKFDVTVVMCPKCWTIDCDGKCETERRVPVIQRDRE